MQAVKKNVMSENEMSVLRSLRMITSVAVGERTSEISELVAHTGIKSSDEVLRALYTLEGKHLVTPEPEGDFTSNLWRITERGVQALDLMFV